MSVSILGISEESTWEKGKGHLTMSTHLAGNADLPSVFFSPTSRMSDTTQVFGTYLLRNQYGAVKKQQDGSASSCTTARATFVKNRVRVPSRMASLGKDLTLA